MKGKQRLAPMMHRGYGLREVAERQSIVKIDRLCSASFDAIVRWTIGRVHKVESAAVRSSGRHSRKEGGSTCGRALTKTSWQVPY
jgi:hypothetical protein